jgi:hypothetical protein
VDDSKYTYFVELEKTTLAIYLEMNKTGENVDNLYEKII